MVRMAHSIPLFVAAGYDGRFRLFDIQGLSLLHDLCVFTDMGISPCVSVVTDLCP